MSVFSKPETGATPDSVLTMSGSASQVEWAERIKRDVNDEFDRVAKAFQGVAIHQAPVKRAATEAILVILEDLRKRVMNRQDAGYFIHDWQNISDQVRQMLFQDDRYQSLKSRGNAPSEGPAAGKILLALGLLLAVAPANLSAATDFAEYRGLRFGMDLAAVSKKADPKMLEPKSLHQRPAVIQEVEWQTRGSASETSKNDPVKEELLEFYNGELFRIVVTYDRYKIEGMTPADMIEAISLSYGQPALPKTQIVYHSNFAETAAVIARWGDVDYSYDLVRTGDETSYSLVLYSKRVDALAQASIVEAFRLDAKEAPQRELSEQKAREQDQRVLLEKARSANRPNFRP